MCIIQLRSGSDHLTLRIHGRSKPDSQSYWDANWLHCTADASAGAVRGRIDWQVRNEDLARFMHSLERLAKASEGEALLDTLDGWLDVRIVRDDQGHIEARCQLVDDPAGGNSLEFRLPLDEAVLPVLTGQVRVVLDRFPAVGTEGA